MATQNLRSALKSVTLIVLMTLVLSVAPGASAQGGNFVLTIVHTNDTHAHIAQFNATGGACSADDAANGQCFGGVARRVTMIDRLRSEGGSMILVDAGDQFQGTLFYTQYKGQEEAPFLNRMGYQAMAVGNHEFDDGPTVLARFIKVLDFPVLAANIDVSKEPALAGLIQPYTVLEVGGQKIGVVGYITEETSILARPGPNVIFNPIEPAVQAAVVELQGKGINKIVALSHAGIERDKKVAATVDGLDVIVGGHSHTYLSNTDSAASGPYPVVVESPGGTPVLIVTDFWMGKYLGRLDVTFDGNGVAKTWSGNPILLDASVPEDAKTLTEVQALAEPLKALTEKVIGLTKVDLDGDRTRCRFEECTMGDLITDAIMWSTASEGTQIVIQNGGSIRSSIPAGSVTLGQVLEVLPFGNMIATFELKGADVWAALEHGVSRAENQDNDGTGRFLQVAGLRYAWDAAKPVGSRVSKVEVKKTDGSYSPLDLNATYRLATNDYTREGGDGFDMLAQKAVNAYDFGPTLDKVLADYIAAKSPVALTLEGRITRLGAAAATAATVTAVPAAAAGATPTRAAVATPVAAAPTAVPTWTATTAPSATPAATATTVPTAVPTWTATTAPSATPAATATTVPTVAPTWTATTAPSATPTATETTAPTATPTATATTAPSATPTATATTTPTATAKSAALPTTGADRSEAIPLWGLLLAAALCMMTAGAMVRRRIKNISVQNVHKE